MHATTVVVDRAKDVFELAFADASGHIIERRRLTRNAFTRCLGNRSALRVSGRVGLGPPLRHIHLRRVIAFSASIIGGRS